MQILTGLGSLANSLEKMSFSPDGRYLAAGDNDGFHVWDLSAGSEPVWGLKSNFISADYCFAPDGSAILGGRGPHHRYDVRTGTTTEYPLPEGIHPDQFSPDGRYALAVYPNTTKGVVRLLCARNAGDQWAAVWRKELTFDPARSRHGYQFVRFSSDSRRLARVRHRGPDRGRMTGTEVESYDAETGELLATWAGELPPWFDDVVAGALGLVAAVYSRTLYVVDTNAPGSGPVKRPNATGRYFTAIAFSQDGSRLATVSNDGTATLWDAVTWEVLCRCEWNIGRLRTVCFAPDGLRCAAGSDTGQIVVWDLDE